jgi:thioesterase domain-containing protein
MTDKQLADFTRYLYENIPLSRAMGVTVAFYDGRRTVLRAPFAGNINHRHTVFGGSIATLGILAGWFVLHQRMEDEKKKTRLVIRKSMVDYLLPGFGDFEAECAIDERGYRQFMKMFDRKVKSRIQLESLIRCDGQLIATHQGEYVALGGSPLDEKIAGP